MSDFHDQSVNVGLPAAELAEIREHLHHLSQQMAEIMVAMSHLRELPAKLTSLEQRLIMIGDIYRYERLQQLLSSDQWFEADKETIRLIADIEGVSNLEDLSPSDIRKFPCGELQVIDKLWTTYSDGRFGFSVQLQAYQELGGTIETTVEQNQALLEQWGDRLGWRAGDRWRKCDELDYSRSAPIGCHPSRWWNSPYGSKMTNYFLGRLMTCEL